MQLGLTTELEGKRPCSNFKRHRLHAESAHVAGLLITFDVPMGGEAMTNRDCESYGRVKVATRMAALVRDAPAKRIKVIKM